MNLEDGPCKVPAQSDVQGIYLSSGSRPLFLSASMTAVVVGVLALQGAFHEHFKLLEKATKEVTFDEDRTWEFIEVRKLPDLGRCDALIIPGGESTTVSLVAARSGLLEPLRDFVK